ncbi:MAG: SDR family NAD(P)-dependent oxidoreductase [Saprospiraceae bacterium]
MEVKDFRQVIDIDLVGPLCQYVAQSMIRRKSGGKIINMNSMMSEVKKYCFCLCCCQRRIEMLTKEMADEWLWYSKI